jgi:hypothetical protein
LTVDDPIPQWRCKIAKRQMKLVSLTELFYGGVLTTLLIYQLVAEQNVTTHLHAAMLP